jgi:hypothetical protein
MELIHVSRTRAPSQQIDEEGKRDDSGIHPSEKGCCPIDPVQAYEWKAENKGSEDDERPQPI